MTHKEAIKNLTELQIRLINDNSEEAIEYNKKIYDTLAYFITQTIPLSEIEDIKTELQDHSFWQDAGGEPLVAIRDVVEIIDRKIADVKGDKTFRYAKEIIEAQSPPSEGVNGEEFEKWLREGDKE